MYICIYMYILDPRAQARCGIGTNSVGGHKGDSVRVYTHTHTYIYIYTHTHTHIYIQTDIYI